MRYANTWLTWTCENSPSKGPLSCYPLSTLSLSPPFISPLCRPISFISPFALSHTLSLTRHNQELPHQTLMRVITGKYKGRHFDIPRTFKARPTTDFAKENLFNVLNSYIDWDEEPLALDLFAGTGSITLELLSRGCSRVICVEKDPLHFRFIKEFIDKLQDLSACPVKGDVFKFLSQCREQFDFIFADPPYVLKEIPELPDMILERNLLREDGLLVLEHGKDHDFSNHPRFVEKRQYGSVNFSFFK